MQKSQSSPDSSRNAKGYYSSRPGAEGYRINKDITWNDASNRKIRVITVGAGVSGILMAYRLQADCANVEHTVYEKSHDIGGTWLDSRYPGCACDVPSHAYAYPFALNPDWPEFFSKATDIWSYLNTVCETFNLRRYMQFKVEVVAATWDEHRGEWKVRLRREGQSHEITEFEDYCHLLILGTGVLNNPKWPDVADMAQYGGRLIYTARWDEEYREEQWASETVAVIGSGSSSLQVVAAMQPSVRALEVFVRTPSWFGFVGGNFGDNRKYAEEEIQRFRLDSNTLVNQAKQSTNDLNRNWDVFMAKSELQKKYRHYFTHRMSTLIKDERLREGFTPKWSLGCRRIPPGDPYMRAIQEPNVNVHFTGVSRFTRDGLIGQDGVERKADTIICATGFDCSYRPRFPVIGRKGVDLKEKWAKDPEGYMGLACPPFPNLIICIGPAWPIEHGSVMGPLQAVSEYVVQVIHKMQNENIKSWVPRQDVTDAFNCHVQEWAKHSVWKDHCRTWYKNNDTGRLNAVWPGSTLHYQQVIKNPRWEDFDIEYASRNMWTFLGMGYTREDRAAANADDVDVDLSPYLSFEKLDPVWCRALNIPQPGSSRSR